MDGERCCLVQVSLDAEEESLLCSLAAVEGVEPASLAHEVLVEGLRGLVEEYGGLDVLATPDDSGQGPWYAEGPFRHLAG